MKFETNPLNTCSYLKARSKAFEINCGETLYVERGYYAHKNERGQSFVLGNTFRHLPVFCSMIDGMPAYEVVFHPFNEEDKVEVPFYV